MQRTVTFHNLDKPEGTYKGTRSGYYNSPVTETITVPRSDPRYGNWAQHPEVPRWTPDLKTGINTTYNKYKGMVSLGGQRKSRKLLKKIRGKSLKKIRSKSLKKIRSKSIN